MLVKQVKLVAAPELFLRLPSLSFPQCEWVNRGKSCRSHILDCYAPSLPFPRSSFRFSLPPISARSVKEEGMSVRPSVRPSVRCLSYWKPICLLIRLRFLSPGSPFSRTSRVLSPLIGLGFVAYSIERNYSPTSSPSQSEHFIYVQKLQMVVIISFLS